jgi:TetR/AcrR family transcriptional repressor of nem operon
MARPREFDEQEAVDRAVDVFWERGYAGTSTRDLSRELTLNPSSLYGAFGDKHGLYLRALDRYAATEGTALRAAATGDGPVVEVLRRWLHGVIDGLCDDPGGRGCLMVNALTEVGSRDAQTRDRAQAAFDGIRAALTSALCRGREAGEVGGDVDPEAAAELLLNVLLGLKVQGRTDADRRRQRAAVDVALRALG